MRDISVWRSELFDEIRTLANKEELERLWFGSDKNAISSYEEEVEHIFSDYEIDEFLSLGTAKSNLTTAQLGALKRFRDAFADYIEDTNRKSSGRPDARSVLNDPKWHSIMKLAKDFVSLIDQKKGKSAT